MFLLLQLASQLRDEIVRALLICCEHMIYFVTRFFTGKKYVFRCLCLKSLRSPLIHYCLCFIGSLDTMFTHKSIELIISTLFFCEKFDNANQTESPVCGGEQYLPYHSDRLYSQTETVLSPHHRRPI